MQIPTKIFSYSEYGEIFSIQKQKCLITLIAKINHFVSAISGVAENLVQNPHNRHHGEKQPLRFRAFVQEYR